MNPKINKGGAWLDAATHDYAATFADRLRLALLSSGKSRAQWATELGVSQALIGAWVTGRRLPSAPLLPVLCDRMNIDAHWLIGCNRNADTFGDVPDLIPPLRGMTDDRKDADLDTLGDQLMQAAKECWRMAQARRIADAADEVPWVPRRPRRERDGAPTP